MRALIRCDAGHRIGLGHLMRCLTLADALREHGGHSQFICRAHEGLPLPLLEQSGHDYTLLPAPQPFAAEAEAPAHADWLGAPRQLDREQTLQAAGMAQFDWLITDHYAIDASWHTPLRSIAGKILAIDDLADRPLDCDLLLDQNLASTAQTYQPRTPSSCRLLLGLKYALLRPEFAHWRARSLQRRSQNPALRRLMLSLGGVDQHNVSGRIAQALARLPQSRDLDIDLIVGPSAPHAQALRHQITQYPVRMNLHQGISNMAQRLAQSDLVIGAAGSSAWERCCLGVPSIITVLADNQRSLAAALQAHGAALTLELDSSDALDAQLGKLLDQCCSTLAPMQQAAAALLDGLGARRVCEAMTRA